VIELRLRTRIPDSELAELVGKVLNEENAYDVLLTGPAKVRRPDGSLLCIYLPGALRDVFAETWSTLAAIRRNSYNRGAASGSKRVAQPGNAGRSKTRPIMSAMLGAFDPYGGNQFCRLTAYTSEHPEAMAALSPVFCRVAELFAEHVPGRYAVQMEYAQRTRPEWVIPGTPFTTITVNNTYSTGIHKDEGDLEAGFSCLAVARHGDYTGGTFCWPEHRLAVDLRDGDLVLMDAHAWHGNTWIRCAACGDELSKPGHRCLQQPFEGATPEPRWTAEPPERVSIVCYYRTLMTECGSADAELARQAELREKLNADRLGLSEAEA
jgi:hypothetical protein